MGEGLKRAFQETRLTRGIVTPAQRDVLKRMGNGEYGIPLDTPDASMWQWNTTKTKIDSRVVQSLFRVGLVNQTYTDDTRLYITTKGKTVLGPTVEDLRAEAARFPVT